MASVYQLTGVSVSSISNVETGKTDPRMSTVTELLSCYGASLSDLEPAPTSVVSFAELRRRSARAAEDLKSFDLGPSNPEERLARKASLGLDTSVEASALLTRS
jgi:transcriptional regulator with XRE-family HTH domain